MKRKYIIILGIIVLTGITFMFTSYGFFNTKIFGNNTSKLSTFKNNPLSITYNDSTNEIVGDASDSFTPGSTITKTFSVTNPGETSFDFGIILDNITNTFTRTEDITYTISLNGEVLKTDVFPTSTTTIIYNQYIEPNETLNYVLTINYYNDPEENQIVDSGATIGAKLVFDYGHGIDNVLVYGNSIQDGTPTPDNPVEIQSVGDKALNLLDKSASLINGIKNETGFTAWAITAFNNNWVVNNLVPNTEYSISYDIECLSVPEHDTDGSNIVGIRLYSGVSDYLSSNFYQTTYMTEGQKIHVSKTFTTPSGLYDAEANYRILAYTNRYLKDGTGVNSTMKITNIQLEKGNNATVYTPYNTLKYKIPLKVTGNNIADFNDETVTFTSGEKNYKTIVAKDGLQPKYNVTYHVKFDYELDSNENDYWVVFGTAVNTSGLNTQIGNRYKIDKDTNSGTIEFTASKQSGNSLDNQKFGMRIIIGETNLLKSSSNYSGSIKISNVIVSYDDNNYEPCNVLDSTLLLDQPLRKVGDYADYIDFKNKKVVRNIGLVDLSTKSYNYGWNNAWYFDDANIKVIGNHSVITPLLSEMYAVDNGSTVIKNDGENKCAAWLSSPGDNHRVAINNDSDSITPTGLLYYIKNTPTEESIAVPNTSIYSSLVNASIGTSIEPSNVVINTN